MNAALLNSSVPRTLNAGPEIPRDPAFDTTWQPVAGGVVVTQPPVASSGGLDLAKIESWAKSGEKLLAAGANPGMSINPSALLSAVAGGAAAGAAIAGVGAVAGAIISAATYVITALIGGRFGPGPSIYDNAGPNVHWWFTNYAPQEYLDWVLSTGRMEVFASRQAAAQGYLVWLLVEKNWVAMPPPWSWWVANTTWFDRLDYDYVWDASGIADHTAKEPWLQDFYANFGVDWLATKNAWLQRNVNSAGPVMMKNRTFVSDEDLEQPGSEIEGASSTKSAVALAAIAAIGLMAAKQ